MEVLSSENLHEWFGYASGLTVILCSVSQMKAIYGGERKKVGNWCWFRSDPVKLYCGGGFSLLPLSYSPSSIFSILLHSNFHVLSSSPTWYSSRFFFLAFLPFLHLFCSLIHNTTARGSLFHSIMLPLTSPTTSLPFSFFFHYIPIGSYIFHVFLMFVIDFFLIMWKNQLTDLTRMYWCWH